MSSCTSKILVFNNFFSLKYNELRRKRKGTYDFLLFKYNALRDLVSFAQFKKREKHPWRSATFSQVEGMGVFHVF